MPLSKAKKAEIERERRKKIKENRMHVVPENGIFVPLYPALKDYVEAEAKRLGYKDGGEWISKTLEKKANGLHVGLKPVVEAKANETPKEASQVARTTEEAPLYDPLKHMPGDTVTFVDRHGNRRVGIVQ